MDAGRGPAPPRAGGAGGGRGRRRGTAAALGPWDETKFEADWTANTWESHAIVVDCSWLVLVGG